MTFRCQGPAVDEAPLPNRNATDIAGINAGIGSPAARSFHQVWAGWPHHLAKGTRREQRWHSGSIGTHLDEGRNTTKPGQNRIARAHRSLAREAHSGRVQLRLFRPFGYSRANGASSRGCWSASGHRDDPASGPARPRRRGGLDRDRRWADHRLGGCWFATLE
jgi:hypothetical protein